tara:strand:- start:305 stop:460 length:156 start_codon:yes stop_codon:yes gene_type:complete
MSMLSKYVERQIKKRGAKECFLWVAELITKATPSKKDDQMVAEIKKILKGF